ncbi:helix-turn-helix transcriptional regulator [Mesorhizobium sp. CAU 1732]|uniref:helix-turn-helix transcriptional regulator n=1 Tax=Mesorhizobium sp. CAU 1732 TaxID=3140358 RepID=UPI00325FEA9A
MRDAAWGRSNWGEACLALAEALPGSASSIANYDFPRVAMNASYQGGIEQDRLVSYLDYYFSINPWADHWLTAPSEAVSISERDCPSSAFRNTEFFNDWLAPQGNMEAAVGARIDVDAHNIIHFAWHYPLDYAPRYDEPAAAIARRLVPALNMAVANETLLRGRIDAGLRLGRLMEQIDGAAMLVDRHRKLREANTKAAAGLSAGTVFSAASNVLQLRDTAAQRWLDESVVRLAAGLPLRASSMMFAIGEQVYSLAVALAPEMPEPGAILLVRPQQLVLVVLKLLVGAEMRIDEASLRFAFGLSASEIRLCELLVNGHSLSDAARLLKLSDGTIRQRVKIIFHKTHTHRQGELIAVLGRFSRSV